MTKTLLLCASTVAMVLGSGEARAQDILGDGRTVFEAAYFETFNVTTALDMVQRVPGFDLEQGGGQRGFGGAAGNVLIDGERPSSKQGLATLLRRIPAAEVARIELIRGTRSGLDVRGQTQVLNVVRREDGQSSGSYAVQLRSFRRSPPGYRVSASRSGQLGPFDVSADLERETNRSRVFATEILTDAQGERVETRDETAKEHFRDWESGLQAGARFGDVSVSFNAQGRIRAFDWSEPSFITQADGAENLRIGEYREDGASFEVGGDVEWRLSEGVSLKLIGLFAESFEEGASVFRSFDLAGGETGLRNMTEEQAGERLLRGLATWTMNDRHALEVGAEAALNFLDAQFSLEEDTGSGFADIALPVADTRVEEVRGEAFGAWTHTPTPAVTLEAGLVLEFSRISQEGDATNERTFFYPKPRASLTWTPNDGDQITVLVERRVSQLDFNDFATSTSISEDVTNLGNPDLEPFKTGRAEAQWERRFAEDGVISLLTRYDLRQDAFDFLPVETVSGDRFDTYGNVGDASILTVEAETSVPLDWIGLPGGLFSISGGYNDTQVTDPLTAEDRPLSGWTERYWRIDVRQDLENAPWAWGFDYASNSGSTDYRLAELRVQEFGQGDFDIFIERSGVFGGVLRLDVENIGDVELRRERLLFTPDRTAGQAAGRESRVAQLGQVVRLTLRGTF